MLKLPETPEIPKNIIQSTRTNHELDKALRAQGWTDELSKKVIDDPSLAELLVEVVTNSEEIKRLQGIYGYHCPFAPSRNIARRSLLF